MRMYLCMSLHQRSLSGCDVGTAAPALCSNLKIDHIITITLPDVIFPVDLSKSKHCSAVFIKSEIYTIVKQSTFNNHHYDLVIRK